MRRTCSIVLLLALVLAGSVFSAGGQTVDLEGEWVNVDSRTRGITRLVVSKARMGWAIEAWGKCHPQDCVWGSTVLNPLGSSVEDFSFNQGFAVWNAGFATKYVTLTLNEGRLTTETVTIFRDRSRRANVRNVDVFQRPEEQAFTHPINDMPKINGVSNEASSSSKNADLREIERLEIEWNRINELSSAEGKQRLLADDSYHVGPSGRTYTKAQDVAGMEASFKEKQESNTTVKFVITDKRIRLYNEVAVVTATGISITTQNGARRVGNSFRAIHIWEKRDGRWQLVVDQVTGVAN